MHVDNLDALSLPLFAFSFPRLASIAPTILFALSMSLRMHAAGPADLELKKWGVLSKELTKAAHEAKPLKKAIREAYAVITPEQMEQSLQYADRPDSEAVSRVVKAIPQNLRERFELLARSYYDAYHEEMRIGDLLETDTVSVDRAGKTDQNVINKFANYHYSFSIAVREARMILFPFEDPGLPPVAPVRHSMEGEPGFIPGAFPSPSLISPNHLLRSA